ncbi:MAG: hypothetical protein AB7S65_02975 [Sulfuricurvum sp.]
MGWTCQHECKGFCKLLKLPCTPGIKGCILNKGAQTVFSTGNYEEDKKRAEEGADPIDFAELARSH